MGTTDTTRIYSGGVGGVKGYYKISLQTYS
jgi:hypothetical protein